MTSRRVQERAAADSITAGAGRGFLLSVNILALCAVAVALAGLAVEAPAASATATQPGEIAPKGRLAPEYVDGSFGFALPFPFGSTVNREKRYLSDTALELVRFVQLAHTWSLSVRQEKLPRPQTVGQAVDRITASLRAKHLRVEVRRADAITLDGRQGLHYVATFEADDRLWLRQQAVIFRAPTERYAILFLTPLADEEIALATFRRILDGFEFRRSALMQDRLDAALERGKTLREKIAQPQRLPIEDSHETYMLVKQRGEPIGFLRMYLGPLLLDEHRGVGIRQWTWLFPESGVISYLQNDMFVTHDLSYAKWDSTVRRLEPSARGEGLLPALDEVVRGLRQDDILAVGFTRPMNLSELEDKVIRLRSSFASPAWFVLMPRFVDLTEPQTYAFTAYDNDRKGLILRTLQIAGRTSVVIEGRHRPAFKIEDGEGLMPPFNEVYVDAEGQLLRLKTGTLEMTKTSRETVEAKYGQPVRDALAVFKAYPVPLPEPKTRIPPSPGTPRR